MKTKYMRFMRNNLNKIMLCNFLLSCALMACGVTPDKIRDAVNLQDSEACLESGKPWSGMYFNSDNVYGEYEYDDAYCLEYHDPDANLLDAEICVDLETYQLVILAIKEGRTVIGSLVLSHDYSIDGSDVFTFMPDSEFEPYTETTMP